MANCQALALLAPCMFIWTFSPLLLCPCSGQRRLSSGVSPHRVWTWKKAQMAAFMNSWGLEFSSHFRPQIGGRRTPPSVSCSSSHRPCPLPGYLLAISEFSHLTETLEPPSSPSRVAAHASHPLFLFWDLWGHHVTLLSGVWGLAL